MNDARLIRDIEEKLIALRLPADEEAKRRKLMYKAFEIEQQGFVSSDIELPEGAILIGICNGELCQAKASAGQLWVDGQAFAAISAAAIKASGRPTQSGWEFWTLVYIPRKGFMSVSELRLTDQRKNSKRK
jgi:hypothetical protein